LHAGELTLRDVFADCRSRNKGRRILLIADQFEEVFTTVADEAMRTQFIDVLLAGFPDPAAGGVPDICLMLTMRADFYGRALRHRPLADALQNHVENLGPMNREELQEAIVRPAKSAGVAFEPGLVETLLDTVQSQPGGLPLLQFALREMWGRQERKKITRKSYDEIGGVEGALAQRAETVFGGLTKNGADPQMDKAFQQLFTRLVTLGEGQEDTRRVVERAELGDGVWGLAQRLAGEENRLIVTNASSARETAEVVHEALIRHWPKLVDWVNRDRAFYSWLRQIKSNIELWSANPADDGTLLRGGMLAQATDWLARRRDDLSPTELGYIEASIALRRQAEEEREAARQAEINRQKDAHDQARRRQRQAAVAAVFFFALAIAATASGVLAYQAKQEAVRAEEQAVAERNRAQANFALAREAADSLVADIARGLRNVRGMSADAVRRVLETAKGTIERLAAAAPEDQELQRSRARMLDEFGTTYRALGHVDEALKAYRDSLAIRERLAVAEPGNTERPRDLSISYNNLGFLWRTQGNLEQALKSYRDAHSIRERLAAGDPSNMQWQRDLSLIGNNIGDALMLQGKVDEAAKVFRDSLAIRERLVAADPGNKQYQRDLSVMYNNLGDVRRDQGKLDEALKFYRDSLLIRERLAAADPSNTQWQRDVSGSGDNIGAVLVTQGRLDEALKVFREGHAIRMRLAVADSSNTEWQRDLSESYSKIGGVLEQQGEIDEALRAYRDSLTISGRLAAANRSNAQWQSDFQDRIEKVGSIAYRFVLARDFTQALEVADQAISLAPNKTWLYGKRAHALMLLGRPDEARSLYLQYRGKESKPGKSWETDILEGFSELRAKGLVHPLMDEIAAKFAAHG
jgi:tetratricopeptide (TPR) repeat protein